MSRRSPIRMPQFTTDVEGDYTKALETTIERHGFSDAASQALLHSGAVWMVKVHVGLAEANLEVAWSWRSEAYLISQNKPWK